MVVRSKLPLETTGRSGKCPLLKGYLLSDCGRVVPIGGVRACYIVRRHRGYRAR